MLSREENTISTPLAGSPQANSTKQLRSLEADWIRILRTKYNASHPTRCDVPRELSSVSVSNQVMSSSPSPRNVSQRSSSHTKPRNLLAESGRARPRFKAILCLSSRSTLRLSLLAVVLVDGGVMLLRFVKLGGRVEVAGMLAEEGAGARL